jgi:anti-anti-sigma regulatory factor
MTYDIDFDDTGAFDLVVRASGVFDLNEFLEGRERVLNDPRFRSGMNVLVDHSQLDLSSATIDDVRAAASSAARRYATSGPGRIAIVAPTSVAFGLGRMWQSLTTDELAENSVVVETVAKAEAWLASCL